MDQNDLVIDTNPTVESVVKPTAPVPSSLPPETTMPPNHNSSTLVTIILLVFSYPLGLIVMWLWPKWPKLTKILVTVPMILGVLAGLIFVVFLVVAPKKVTVSVNGTPTNYSSEQTNKPSPFGKLVQPQKSTSDSQANPGTGTTNSQSTPNDNSPAVACKFDSDCPVGKCIIVSNGQDVCSEGKLGQACFLGIDCQTEYCGLGKCTEGKAGDPCSNFMACQSSLDCKNNTCQ